MSEAFGSYLTRGMYRNRALLDTAHEIERCMNCGAHRGGCEPAHSNEPEHGKAVGGKSHDCFFAALCERCHRWYDNQAGNGQDPSLRYDATRQGKREMFTRAMDATRLELWRLGKLRVA